MRFQKIYYNILLPCAILQTFYVEITPEDILQDIFNFFHLQNDFRILNVVVLFERSECNKHDTICQNIFRELLSKPIEVPFCLVFLDNNINTTRIHNMIQNSTSSLIVMINFAESSSMRQIVGHASSNDMSRNAWMFTYWRGDQQDSNSIIDMGRNLLKNQTSIQHDSQLYILGSHKHSIKLFEIYRIGNDEGKLEVVHLATTTEQNLPLDTTVEFIWRRRSDFKGIQLRIAYVNYETFFEASNDDMNTHEMNLDSIKESGKIIYGFSTQLLKMIIENFNISVQWVYAEDNAVGVKDARTGGWTGIIGLLKNRQADVSAFPVSVRPIRTTAVTFSASVENYEYRLFMRKPGLSTSWTTYLDVFHPSYWLSLAISFICFSLCIALFLIVHYKVTRGLRAAYNNYKLESVGTGISAALLSLAMQDVDIAEDISYVSPTSMRMLFFTVCTCGMFNRLAYDAGLTSLLMVKKFDVPIENLNDILSNPEYQLLVRRGTADESFFVDSQDWISQRIWAKTLKEDNSILSYVAGEKYVLDDSNKVLFGESPTVQFSIDSFPCELVTAPSVYGRHSGAYAFTIGSPYPKLFGHYISHIKESGLMPVYAKHTGSSCSSGNGYSPLTYSNIFSAFVVCGIGLALAILYCIFEFLYYSFPGTSQENEVKMERKITDCNNELDVMELELREMSDGLNNLRYNISKDSFNTMEVTNLQARIKNISAQMNDLNHFMKRVMKDSYTN